MDLTSRLQAAMPDLPNGRQVVSLTLTERAVDEWCVDLHYEDGYLGVTVVFADGAAEALVQWLQRKTWVEDNDAQVRWFTVPTPDTQ